MADKYQALRDLLARVNGEDTDDCFNAYLEWRQTFDVEHCRDLLAERDALREALRQIIRVDDSGPLVHDHSGACLGNAEGEPAKIARAALSK